MAGSIKKNYIYNLINTVSGILFPLITFPYVSRTLLADGVGQVQFFDSIIAYIALVTSLGIPLYAVRELARIRDDVQARNKMAIELILLHSALTLLGYIIVFTLAVTVQKIQADVPLFLLLSASLFFNAIGVGWFYTAVEDFKYITVRSLLVRVCSVTALFIFVKSREDLLYYAAIQVTATVGNNVFNFIRLRKYIAWNTSCLSGLQFKKHLQMSLRLFVLNLIVSLYVILDSVMLGFLKDETAVGYYAGAMRMTKIVLGIVTSLGVVLLPRFSNLISVGKREEFIALGNKAISFTLAMVLPMAVGLVLLAHPIIMLFCGISYEPSILTLQILAPIIIFIGFSGLLGMQVLYPLGQEKLVIKATLLGAILNITLNLLLIPKFSQYGAAVATFVAEFTVMAVVLLAGKKYLPFRFLSRQNREYVIATLLMTVVLLPLNFCGFSMWQSVVLCPLVGCVVYFGYLTWRRDPFYLTIRKIIIKKLRA